MTSTPQQMAGTAFSVPDRQAAAVDRVRQTTPHAHGKLEVVEVELVVAHEHGGDPEQERQGLVVCGLCFLVSTRWRRALESRGEGKSQSAESSHRVSG